MNDNGAVKYSVSLDDEQMKNDASRVVSQFEHIGAEAQKQGSKIDQAFQTAASNIGKAFATIGIATTLSEIGRQVISVRGEFEKLEVAFEVMLGSADKANSLMKELVQTAATTPFDLQGVANGAKQLLAYGVQAKDVNDTLVRLGNIASGLSIPLNDLVMLYGTTMTQGRLFTQDLRQFMGRGIPLADELAKQFGVAKDKVSELVTAGKVGFPQVQRAIESLTNEGGKFYGLMEKQSKTVAGQISNIGDSIDMMFNEIGKQNEGVINTALSSVSYLVEHYKQFGTVLLTVAAAYGEYKAALMVVAAYNNMIASQNASIEAQRQAELQTILEKTAAQAAETESESANAAAKSAEVSAIDAKVVAMQAELQANVASATANYNAATSAAAAASLAVESAQARVAAAQEQLAAVTATGNGEAIEAAEIELNTAAQDANAASRNLQAARANVQTAAQARETASTRLSTFQTQVDTVAKNANAASTGVLTAATNMCTAAWKGLKTAIATNPLGIALVAITTIIGALAMFSSSTDEATSATERFNEAVQGDQTKLDNYRAALENTTKGTKTYNDALSGLVSLGQEYNITIETENGSLKDQKKAYEDLTAAIKKHASEKLLTESAAKANEDAMNSEREAMDALIEDAREATHKEIQQAVENIDGVSVTVYKSVDVASQNIQKITSATWNMISADVMSHAQEIASAFEEGSAQGTAAVNAEVAQIEGMLRSLGVTDKEIQSFHNDLYDYVNTSAQGFQTAYGELNRTQAQIQGLAGATSELGTTTTDATELAGMGYDQLKQKQEETLQKINEINNNTTAPKVDDTELQNLKSLLIDINNLLPSKVTVGTDAELSKRLNQLKQERDQVAYGSKEWKNLNRQIGEVNKTLQKHRKTYAETTTSNTRNRTSSSNSNKKTQKQIQNEREQLRKQQERFDEDTRAYQLQQQREAKDMVFQTEQATIDALEDGEAKKRRQIQLDHDKEKEQIQRDWEDLRQQKIDNARRLFEEDPTNNGKQFTYNESDFAYTDAEKTNRAKRDEANDAETQRKIDELNQKKIDADNDYLEKYGTFEEKRMAITAKYNQKIARETTESGKKSLQKELESALADLNLEELKKNLDWSVVFGDLSKVTSSELKKVKKQLIAFKKSDAYKKQTPEQIKVIEDAINQIDDALAEKGGLFGGLIDSLDNYRAAVEAVTKAQEDYDNAITDADKEQKRQALQQAKENKNAAQSTRDKAVDSTISKLEALSSAIGELGSSSEMSLTDLGSVVSSVTSAFGEAAGKIGGIIGAILQLLDQIQTQGFDKFVDNVFKSVFGGVGGVFQSIFGKTSLWGSDHVEDTLENLTVSNSNLERAIENLTDVMKQQAGSDATKTYEMSKKNLEQEMANTQRQMQVAGGASSNGFLGIGGHHSANKHIDDEMTLRDWEEISKIVGKTVRSAGDFWDLSSEEMAKVEKYGTQYWTKIQNAAKDGYKDVSDYMDSYIEYYQKLIDLQDEYNETVTQLSFDTAKSDLESLIEDTGTSAKDVIKKVNEYMRKAIVSQVLTKNMQEKLRDWYNDFASAMADDTLDAAEKAALSNRYKEIYDEAKKQVDAAMEAAGIDEESSYEQEASTGAWQSMSEDTGKELNGRFTALQATAVQIFDKMKETSASFVQIAMNTGETFSVVTEMNNLILTCSTYLEQITRNTDVLPAMRRDIEKIKLNTDKL